MKRNVGSLHFLTLNVVHYVVILSHCNESCEHNLICFVISHLLLTIYALYVTGMFMTDEDESQNA